MLVRRCSTVWYNSQKPSIVQSEGLGTLDFKMKDIMYSEVKPAPVQSVPSGHIQDIGSSGYCIVIQTVKIALLPLMEIPMWKFLNFTLFGSDLTLTLIVRYK